jgi:hypothetical protein
MSVREFLKWLPAADGGLALQYAQRSKPVLHVMPHKTYASMWRIHFADGSQSDMANLTRAKDAALYHARAMLDGERNAAKGPLEAG